MLRNIAFKHRVIGAIFIISLGIIVIPAIFDKPAIDTLTVQDSVPNAPSRGDWQELSEIDYSFNELVNDLQVEEAAAPPALVEAPLVSEQDELAPLALVVEDETAPAEVIVQEKAAEPALLAQAPAPKNEPVSTLAKPKTTKIAPETKVAQATESLIAKNIWAVQLGAFSSADNANTLLQRLQDKGYAAYIHQVADKQLTRVLVGVEANEAKAAELLADLDSKMHLKGIIIKFDPERG